MIITPPVTFEDRFTLLSGEYSHFAEALMAAIKPIFSDPQTQREWKTFCSEWQKQPNHTHSVRAIYDALDNYKSQYHLSEEESTKLMIFLKYAIGVAQAETDTNHYLNTRETKLQTAIPFYNVFIDPEHINPTGAVYAWDTLRHDSKVDYARYFNPQGLDGFCNLGEEAIAYHVIDLYKKDSDREVMVLSEDMKFQQDLMQDLAGDYSQQKAIGCNTRELLERARLENHKAVERKKPPLFPAIGTLSKLIDDAALFTPDKTIKAAFPKARVNTITCLSNKFMGNDPAISPQ